MRHSKLLCQRVNVGMVLRFCRPYIDEKNFYFDTQRLPLPYKGGMGAWSHVHPKLLTFCPSNVPSPSACPRAPPIFSLHKGGMGLCPMFTPSPCPSALCNIPSPPTCPRALPIFSLHKGGMGAWPPCPPQALALLSQQRSVAAHPPPRTSHFPPSVKGVWGLGPHVNPRPLPFCPP